METSVGSNPTPSANLFSEDYQSGQMERIANPWNFGSRRFESYIFRLNQQGGTMKEAVGNIWNMNFDVICITTNGVVKPSERAVMGAGIAKEALYRFQDIDLQLGRHIKHHGNSPTVLREPNGECSYYVLNLPTKWDWREKSDLELIVYSLSQIKNIVRNLGQETTIESVGIPRPGCGHGGLSWELEVKPAISPLLNDTYTIVSFK
jgi:hypothetical protein